MSNFAGVTFVEQAVTPSDDGVIRRAALTDGILSGCGLSYSGSTLTMAAGYLLAAGRQIRHTAASNWAIVDATSGYARLVLTIDLTQAATKDSFEQVTTSVQYASSLNGFSSLTQNDINGSGTKYQIVLCVVSLGTGGISGIASKLEASVAVMDDASRLTKGTIPAARLPAGLLKRKLVWENSSPTSEFGAADVVLSAADGMNVIKWDIVYLATKDTPAATLTWSSEYDAPGHRVNFTIYGSTVNVSFRQVAQDGTTFHFETAKSNGNAYPSALIPWRIYAWYLNLEV